MRSPLLLPTLGCQAVTELEVQAKLNRASLPTSPLQEALVEPGLASAVKTSPVK